MNENSAIRLARPSVSPRKKRLLVAVLAVAAITAAACSDGGNENSQVSTAPAAPAADPAPAPQPAPPAAGPVNDLPEVDVINVVSGETLLLSSLAPADRPILAWFWAPH